MKPTLSERETIIRTDESAKTFTVYTYNGKIKRKLYALNAAHPELCRIVSDDSEYGDATFTVNKECVFINFRPKKKVGANNADNLHKKKG